MIKNEKLWLSTQFRCILLAKHIENDFILDRLAVVAKEMVFLPVGRDDDDDHLGVGLLLSEVLDGGNGLGLIECLAVDFVHL